MSCSAWRVIRRPEYREDLHAIEARIAEDNAQAAADMWLLIDEQVDQLADPNFPRRASSRVLGAHELVADENYIVYFDQDEDQCMVTVRAVVCVWPDSFRRLWRNPGLRRHFGGFNKDSVEPKWSGRERQSRNTIQPTI